MSDKHEVEDPRSRPPMRGRNGGTLRPFVKGKSGNPAGRPRKVVNLLKFEGYKNEEIKTMFSKICSMTREETEKFAENPDATVIEIGALKLAKDLMKKGRSEFLDYVIAKKTATEPMQIDLTVTDKNKLMTIEEIEKELESRGLPKKFTTSDE